MPKSAARLVTIFDSLPVIIPTGMPACISILMPWPSRLWKALLSSPELEK